jgi:hypothetical protein
MGINDRRDERRRQAAEDDAEDLLLSAAEYLDRKGLRASCIEQHTYCIMPDNGEWIFVKPSTLQDHIPEFCHSKFKAAVLHVMAERGMCYNRMTSSYKEQPKDTFNLLNRDRWVQPAPDTDCHWLFHVMIQSLGGNKPENMAHLEHCIAWKYWEPKDSWKLPCIVLHGQGGVGKNMMVEAILGTLFAGQTTCALKKNIVGDFNGLIVGKAVVLIDEGAEGSSNEMKATVGNEVLTINPKQINQYKVENTAWYWVSSNKREGGIWLDRTAADRRYSVLKVDKTLPYWICRHNGITDPTPEQLREARNWCLTEGEKIARDPGEVAKWISHLLVTHVDKGLPQELHGKDFDELMGLQEPLHEQMIRAIFNEPGFTHIERPFLNECYNVLVKETRCQRPIKPRSLYGAVTHIIEEEYSDKSGLPYIHLDQKRQTDGKTAWCWWDTRKPTNAAHEPNRDTYLQRDTIYREDKMTESFNYKWVGPDLG